jgi:hypothetical protein
MGVASAVWFFFVLVTDVTQDDEDIVTRPFSWLFAGYSLYYAIVDVRDKEALSYLPVFVGSGATTAVPLLVGAHFLDPPASVGFTLLVADIVGGLTWYGERRERAARNIFTGLLELDETAQRRTAVIAR